MMKTWAVLAQKGGSGKTTIALHLAIVAHTQGRKTAVLDVDPQRSASRWGQIRTEDWPQVISSTVPQLGRELARLAADQFELAVIDTSPRADRDMLDVSALANLIVIPCRPSIMDLPAIEDTVRLLRDVGRLERIALVMNLTSARTGEADEARPLLESMARLAVTQIGDRVGFRRALTGGNGVTEFAPDSTAAHEITALYSELERI